MSDIIFRDSVNDPFQVKNKLNEIHVRIQQRNGRKCITTVSGIEKDKHSLKDILRQTKKKFNCNGTVIKEEDVLQFQGDQRENLKEYLMKILDYESEDIKVHGF